MYAIIETGGKQYNVKEGDVIVVEKLNVAAGEEVVFDKVLAVGKEDSLTVGAPLVAGASVKAEVVAEGKGKKIIVYKCRFNVFKLYSNGNKNLGANSKGLGCQRWKKIYKNVPDAFTSSIFCRDEKSLEHSTRNGSTDKLGTIWTWCRSWHWRWSWNCF